MRTSQSSPTTTIGSAENSKGSTGTTYLEQYLVNCSSRFRSTAACLLALASMSWFTRATRPACTQALNATGVVRGARARWGARERAGEGGRESEGYTHYHAVDLGPGNACPRTKTRKDKLTGSTRVPKATNTDRALGFSRGLARNDLLLDSGR